MRKVLVLVGVAVMAASMASPMVSPAFAEDEANVLDTSTMVAARGRRVRRGVRAKGPGMEETIRRIVEDTMKKGGEWNYMAKRMRPPKGKKWQGRWNNLGTQGWELVGQNENVYIFKRPAQMAGRAGTPMTPGAPMKEMKTPKAVKGGGKYAPPADTGGSPGRRPSGREWR
ncbi:MAG: hypothetical protein HY543_01335 [Deltaproteobacteria bacterium]|nr:hypothetical protein [Deltaproteobacteria bacterium]